MLGCGGYGFHIAPRIHGNRRSRAGYGFRECASAYSKKIKESVRHARGLLCPASDTAPRNLRGAVE